MIYLIISMRCLKLALEGPSRPETADLSALFLTAGHSVGERSKSVFMRSSRGVGKNFDFMSCFNQMTLLQEAFCVKNKA